MTHAKRAYDLVAELPKANKNRRKKITSDLALMSDDLSLRALVASCEGDQDLADALDDASDAVLSLVYRPYRDMEES